MNDETTLAREAAPAVFSEPRRTLALPWALAVVALIVLNTVVLIRWVHRDTRPAAWDEAVHTMNTYEYRDRLATGSFFEVMRPVLFKYPPLYNFSVIPFLGRIGDAVDAGAMANVFYLGALVWICYLIGAFLLDRWAGLGAAMLVGFYPLIFELSHATMLDLALTTWVAAAFYGFLKSEDFSRPGWSAVCGALLGLGMLVKPTAAAYLVGPAIPALVTCLRRRTFAGPILALVVFLAVITPWYAINGIPILARISEVKDHPPAGGITFHGWTKFLWYPMALFEQINLPFLVLFTVGLIFSFVKKSLRPVLLWYFASMVIFSLIHNNNIRYMMPALPAVAVLSVSWVSGRRWAFGVVAAVAASYFVAFHFLSLPLSEINVKGVPLALYRPDPALVEDWKHKEIIARIAETRDTDSAISRVVVVSNMPYFHSVSLNVDLREAGIDNFSFVGPSKSRWLDFTEFVLVKTGSLGPEFTIGTVKKYADWLAAPPAWFTKSYKTVGRWPMPDGSEAILYHADPDAISVSKDEMMSVSLREVQFPGLLLRDVDVRALAQSPEDTAKGRLAKITARAKSIDYRGLQVENAEVELIRPQINLPRYREEGELQVLALDRLSVKGTLRSETLLALAGQKARWLSQPQATFNEDVIVLAGRIGGKIPVRIEARVDNDGEVLQPRLQSVSIAGIPIPVIFVRALTDITVPLSPNREWPYRMIWGTFRERATP